MSHCVHFLSRLERVSMAHADFALELYRDPQLVKLLMAEFSDIYGEERAALALGDDGAGPYVVVAADGGFVTCLGEKMKPRGLTVVTRELLESRRMFSEEFSEAVQRYNKLKEKGGTTRMLRRIIGNGQLVSREDVEQTVAVLPALQMDFIDHIITMSVMIAKERDRLIRSIQASRKLRGRAEDIRRLATEAAAAHWTGVWSIATCHAIVAAGGEHSLMSMYYKDSDQLGPAHTVSFLEGHSGLALRSLWGVGMRGVAVVGLYESHLHRLNRREDVIGNVASLTIAALRHPELRGRVTKHLEKISRQRGLYSSVDFVITCAMELISGGLQSFYEAQCVIGREMYLKVRRNLSPSHPDYYEKISDVPDSLLRTLSVMFPSRFNDHEEALLGMFACLPWLAEVEIGELFLPRRLNDTLLTVGPSHAELGMELLNSQAVESYRSEPYIGRPRVGRNDPCPCDSGRKFKQCCLNRESEALASFSEMTSLL